MENILKYKYDYELQGYKIVGYESIADDGILTIPDAYEEYPVIRIDKEAFKSCSEIKHLIIGRNISYIGNQAFAECSNLETIAIRAENGLAIGNGTFSGCKNLTKLILSKGLQSIGDGSFEGCEQLTHITIPSSVWSIDQTAFNRCKNLTSITIPNSVKIIRNGDIFSQCENLTIYCEAAEKPSGWHENWNSNGYPVVWGCTNFGDFNGILYALKGSELHAIGYSDPDREINLPIRINQAEVTHIGQAAFKGCRGLKEVNISNVDVKIGISAFKNCSSLKEIIFSKESSSYWDEIIATQSIFSSDMVIDFKYFEPINLDLQYFPYGASGNSTLTYAGDGDTDFTGFTFNGLHSWHDLNLLRVSNDRYTDELSPEKMDLTAENPGGNGQYYFGSHHKSKKFSIEIAFDSLDESQLRKLKQLCASETMSDLIFDENPYKVYTAKITGTPSLKYICFNENGKRIYKGEGNIEFTCYWPYAHTPTQNTKISNKLIEGGVFGRDGKEFKNYVNLNKNDWKESSALHVPFIQGSNYGDLPVPFILRDNSTISSETKYKVGECEITVGDSDHTYYGLEWDSKTGLVKAKLKSDEAVYKPIFFSGTSLGGIPIGESLEWGKWDSGTESFKNNGIELEYDFWYY